MGRLIRTEKEIEGRFTEQWLVVEEDALDQWPAGPLAVVGRPAERIDGLERARGQARYTADIRLPGMLHTAIARSPHARERVRRLDLAAALAVPGLESSRCAFAYSPCSSSPLSAARSTQSAARHGRAGRRPRPRSLLRL